MLPVWYTELILTRGEGGGDRESPQGPSLPPQSWKGQRIQEKRTHMKFSHPSKLYYWITVQFFDSTFYCIQKKKFKKFMHYVIPRQKFKTLLKP